MAAMKERARDVDTELPGLDPWRPLPDDCVCLSMRKPKTDLDMQRVSELWNGRRDVDTDRRDRCSSASASRSTSVFSDGSPNWKRCTSSR